MSSPKYKLTLSELERPSNIHKLERDGFSKERIINTMYKLTDGASKEQRERIIGRLYDRKE